MFDIPCNKCGKVRGFKDREIKRIYRKKPFYECPHCGNKIDLTDYQVIITL